MASSAEIERQAEASRERLAATLDELRYNLTPEHLAREVLGATGAKRASSAVRSIESTIRQHPLPMILIGVGGALWLSSIRWSRSTRQSGMPAELSRTSSASANVPPKAPSRSQGAKRMRDDIAQVGRSIADRAYRVFRARAQAKLNQYAKAASSGLDSASEQLLNAAETLLGKAVDEIFSAIQPSAKTPPSNLGVNRINVHAGEHTASRRTRP